MEENIEITDNENENISTIDEIRVFRNKCIFFLLAAACFLALYAIFISPVFMNSTRKPAIYLYPEKTAVITVKLDKSIKYKNVIPKYKDGWLVEAEPNGFLRDLQPKYTKCDKLPYKEFGFEYSKQSCEINKYPYIYWDGVQTKKPLPKKDKGFIVKKDDIEEFLKSKADELKFNDVEKTEFVRYWTKIAKEKSWKQLKIYFLQNEEVNDYLPVYVNPKPDSIYRIQIVMQKANHNEKIEKQILIPIERKGFTLVEWGGIIK